MRIFLHQNSRRAGGEKLVLGGSSPNSSSEKAKGSLPVRKKEKFVRRKKLSTLAVGDGVSMDEIPSYAERALVVHARGRNLS